MAINLSFSFFPQKSFFYSIHFLFFKWKKNFLATFDLLQLLFLLCLSLLFSILLQKWIMSDWREVLFCFVSTKVLSKSDNSCIKNEQKSRNREKKRALVSYNRVRYWKQEIDSFFVKTFFLRSPFIFVLEKNVCFIFINAAIDEYQLFYDKLISKLNLAALDFLRLEYTTDNFKISIYLIRLTKTFDFCVNVHICNTKNTVLQLIIVAKNCLLFFV